jgi:hypothetical protein
MIKGQLQQLLSHRENDITAIVTDRERITIMDGWMDGWMDGKDSIR